MADNCPALPAFMRNLKFMLALRGSESPLFPRRRVVVLIAIIRALFDFQHAVINKPGFFVAQAQRTVVIYVNLPEGVFK